MNTSKEREVKFPIDNLSDIEELIRGIYPEKTKRQVDVYLDIDNYDLFKKGIFIRIRDNSVLDIKYNPNELDHSHIECDEYRFGYPLSSANFEYVRRFIHKEINFNIKGLNQDGGIVIGRDMINIAVIDKKRSLYISGDAEVSIDVVKDLGTFVEIESLVGNINSRYTNWMVSNGIKNMKAGYVEMYLKKTNREVYELGRYKF